MKSSLVKIIIALVVIAVTYAAAWFGVQAQINKVLVNIETLNEVKVTGFPGGYHIAARLAHPELEIPAMEARFWPLPNTQAVVAASQGFRYNIKDQTLEAKNAAISFTSSAWPTALSSEALLEWAQGKPVLDIAEASVDLGDSRVTASGLFTFNDDGLPQGSAKLTFHNYDNLIVTLENLKVLKRTARKTIISLLHMYSAARQDKTNPVISFTLKLEGNDVMLGPFRVGYIPSGAIFWGVQKSFSLEREFEEIQNLPDPELPPEVKKALEPKPQPAPQQ